MMLDFNELTNPRTEIELMDDEAEALLKSPRCPTCNHLGIFHQWERHEAGPAGKSLVCRFHPATACAEELA
jgi:hypothetical protein